MGLEVEVWRTGSLLDIFLYLSSLLLFFASRPGTIGFGTGIYHLLIPVTGRWSSPCEPYPLKGHPERYWSVVGLIGSYG